MSVTPDQHASREAPSADDYHHRAQQHRPKDDAAVAREVRRLALLGWKARDIASLLHLHPHLVVLLLDRVSA